MKKFLFYISKLILIVITALCAVDFLYTKVYQNSSPRTKFQLLLSNRNQKIDNVFLGSSRVENNIVTEIIEKETGEKALNLGFQASKCNDIYIILLLLKEYNIKTKRIFIQMDYNYNLNGNSEILQYEMRPFMRDNEIIKSYFFNINSDFNLNYYVPFYRFARNDLKLGFREMFLNLVNKKTNIIKQKGYVPLYGCIKNNHIKLPNKINSNNIYFEKIQKYVEQNKLNVIYFCAPYCKNTKNLDFIDKLKTKVPNLVDFSSAIKIDSEFQNNSHLNNIGAKRFTEIVVKKCILN